MIYAPFVLVAVLVSARSSAEWIPNDLSDSAVDQRLPVDSNQTHAKATVESNEERVGPSPHVDLQLFPSMMRDGESSAGPLVPILESSVPSSMRDKSVAEPLSSNKDVSHLKNNKEFTQRMEELGINLDEVVAAVQTLQRTRAFINNLFSKYSLTLMMLGSIYFKIFASSSPEIKAIHPDRLKTTVSRDVVSPEFKGWVVNHLGSGVSIQKVYGKMLWLATYGGLKKCDTQDLAEMAFGSEFFKVHEIDLSLLFPNSETFGKPKHRIQHLINQDDVDLEVKQKLRAFADDPDSFDYSVEELLRRAKDAVLEDEFTHLKRNEAFTTQMKTLGINLDDTKFDVQMLRTRRELPKYNDYSLALMILGSKYFKAIEKNSPEFGEINRSAFLKTKHEYLYSKEFKDWKDERWTSGVEIKRVYRKLLWLTTNENWNIKDEELAEMAYGCEYFGVKHLKLDEERVKYQFKLLKERGGMSKNAIEKLEKEFKQNPDSFIAKNAELLKRKVKHMLLGAELDEETHKRRKIA